MGGSSLPTADSGGGSVTEMTSGGLFTQKIKQIFSVNIESGKVLFRMAATDPDGNTELHWHAYKGDVEGINLALKRVPEYLNFKNNKGKTPLDIAEERHQVQAITLLRKHGARLASET
jgi:hypothetical protein